jgi:hypothetical protein
MSCGRDDEFPATAQLLFDASVEHYLSLEDIVVLGQVVTGRLIHQSDLGLQDPFIPNKSSDLVLCSYDPISFLSSMAVSVVFLPVCSVSAAGL